MLARIVIGYGLALPMLVSVLVQAVTTRPTYTVGVTMASTTPGHLQVFFDSGAGYREVESGTAWLDTSGAPIEYRLPIPAGRYRGVRIDPATLPGQYTVTQARIYAPDGTVVFTLPLADLTRRQLVMREAQPDRLVIDVPPGQSDPQLLYERAARITLRSQWFSLFTLRTVALLVAIWAAGIGATWLAQVLGRRVQTRIDALHARVSSFGAAHPSASIWLVALVATIISAYPVVFLGRSFVAPTNGAVRLLYDAPLFAPGAGDTTVEDTRGSDVGAALLAFMPYTRVQREALSRGELPLWNRYNAAGRPLWGQGQTFLFDPLHWPTLVLPNLAAAWDLKFVLHRLVFAAGVGLAAFAATATLAPALMAAAAAPFVSVYLYRLNHPATFALTYAAWVLLAWFLLARASARAPLSRAALLLAASTALTLLSSPPKEGIVMLLSVTAVGILAILLSSGSWRDRSTRLIAAAIGGVACVLVTAPHWLIFLDTLRVSITAYDTPYATVAGRDYLLALFATPFVPGLLRPGMHPLALVLLVAIVSAPLAVWRSQTVLACALVSFASLAVAFGAIPPAWLIRLPFLGRIGHIEDVFITAAVPALLVVTAAGAAVLISGGRVRATVVSLVVALVSVWLIRQVEWLARPGEFQPFALGLTLLPAVLLPWCLVSSRSVSRSVSSVVAAAVACLLLLLPTGLHANTGQALLEPFLMQPRLRPALETPSPAIDTLRQIEHQPTRVSGLDWWLMPGTQALYGLEGIGGPDALYTAVYEELVDAAGIWRARPWLTRVPTEDLDRLAPLLDLLGVRYLIGPAHSDTMNSPRDSVARDEVIEVTRRATAWPRAFFVDGAVPYREPGELLAMIREAKRPIAGIQASDAETVKALGPLMRPSSTAMAARSTTLTVNTSTFQIGATGPGLAVLTETFLPGEFRATLNGSPVPYVRVNHAFKAVAIPGAGDWTIKFEYRPAHWTLALAMAALGGLLIVMLVIPSVSR